MAKKNNANGKKKKSFIPKRNQKREIVFDPEARKAYLRGFSERKRQRRAFGLAMQKVKDRKEKIEQRSQDKKEEEERVQQAEQQKQELLEEAMRNSGMLKEKDEEEESNSNDDDDDDDSSSDDESTNAKQDGKNILKNTKTYNDRKTEKQWGGRVTVTTTEVALDDDDDDGEDDKSGNGDDDISPTKAAKKSVDVEQKYAGSVQKYMSELKGKMPGKKKDKQVHKRKGKNGAADMRGMGGAANLKTAQKVLSKMQASQKGGPSSAKNKKGKRGKR